MLQFFGVRLSIVGLTFNEINRRSVASQNPFCFKNKNRGNVTLTSTEVADTIPGRKVIMFRG